ncbi:hypothetical protein Val02_14660 [Virgisporangium aliadipatigenens]|uniref:Helix-hairpin-helix domain-containing protein n=1 Tax=Virgisporangium aliadipatigenens TaxID=741659 RepID=A0A8J3YII1_9ACTN|nr:hypothetical protein [Virgisporangium aliadipatigenens]GIJ44580.1 hypothetical protein Val02_14660 [Virgisporangium aliadipatigenens]
MGKRARPRKPPRLIPERYWKDLAFWTGGWATPALLFHAGWRLGDDSQIQLSAYYVVAILIGTGPPFDVFGYWDHTPFPLPVRLAILAAVWVLGVVHAGWAAPILHRRVAAINAVAALRGIEVEMPTAPDAPAAPALDATTAAAIPATAFPAVHWQRDPAPARETAHRVPAPHQPTAPAVPTPAVRVPLAPYVPPTSPIPPALGAAPTSGAAPVPGRPSGPTPPHGTPVPYLVPALAVARGVAVPRMATHDWLVFSSGMSAARPTSGIAVAEARARLRRRKKARQILAREPDLAFELRIGRPDLPRDYDDGGLIDINHVPAEVLVRELEIPAEDAHRLIAQREAHGGFSHPEELVFYCDLTPERLTVISGRLVFVPA